MQTLYESSTALGFRKSTKIETGKEIQMEKMETLIRENRELKQEGGKKVVVVWLRISLQIENMKVKIQMTEKNWQERRKSEEKQKNEELNFYRRTNQQLKSQIESIQTPAK